MGTLYAQTTGSATNSGSSDNNVADLTGSAATVSGSTVSLDGSPDLSGVQTSGVAQAAIYLAQATNTNRKVFWITAVDNGAKTVTVDVAPTGVTSSSWAIGGRFTLPSASHEGTLRGGDTLIVNDSVTASGSIWTFRVSGDDTGPIRIKGKEGVLPKLTATGSGSTVIGVGGGIIGFTVEGVELAQTHPSTGSIIVLGSSASIINCKISSSPTNGIVVGTSANTGLIFGTEITGCAGDGISGASNRNISAISCYIHDNGGDGIQFLVAGSNIIDCAIVNNLGCGILMSSAITGAPGFAQLISGNTIANNGSSGIDVADSATPIFLYNNIFYMNGDGINEYNVKAPANTFETYGHHSHNLFFHTGSGSDGSNLQNLVTHSTEITLDPLFVDEANGDYRLQASSPARAAGQAVGLGTPANYRDLGAYQRQEPTAGGTTAHVIGS